ncbi:MAG: hypothetical protein ACI311_06745, partial [Bacilli bacterium]
ELLLIDFMIMYLLEDRRCLCVSKGKSYYIGFGARLATNGQGGMNRETYEYMKKLPNKKAINSFWKGFKSAEVKSSYKKY